MTRADVLPTPKGAILKQDGKQLNLEIIEPQGVSISVISLDPPPLKYDLHLRNLKRIEVQVPARYLADNNGKIMIRLSGE